MATQTTRVGDLTVAVQRPDAPGGRPPVLLIHGMFGGAWMWTNYQDALARRGYESHALNLRGHHDSRAVRDIGQVGIRSYVEDALTVATSLGNPIVVGHSMGGLIAQKVAEAGACRALVLIASAPPRWIPVASGTLAARQVRYLRELLLSEPLLPNRADADVLMFNRTPLPDRDAQYARLVPESGRAGRELSLGTVAVNAARVTAPVMVITGLDDRFVVPRVARALARKYRARFREYRSFAHHIITEPGWEQPFRDVANWMDEVTRGA